MKMKKALKILDVIITVLLLFVIVCNLYIAIARRATGKLQPTTFGFSTAVVVSGSMEDAISVNDLIIDKAQKEYSVGDIISFESGSSVVTHRIVGEKDGGFVTKGDANNTEDRDIVKKENIIGKVVLTVPKIGLDNRIFPFSARLGDDGCRTVRNNGGDRLRK